MYCGYCKGWLGWAARPALAAFRRCHGSPSRSIRGNPLAEHELHDHSWRPEKLKAVHTRPLITWATITFLVPNQVVFEEHECN
jgi:hypothetical protein